MLPLSAQEVRDAGQTLNIGKAGEYITCAHLLLQGYPAYLSDQGMPYDLVVDIGTRLVRVQVKCRTTPIPIRRVKTPVYQFALHKLNRSQCDIVAFVALDIQRIAYLPINKVRKIMRLYPEHHQFTSTNPFQTNYHIDQLPFHEALSHADH